MTLSSILSGLMINAASLALARKLILVSIDIYFMFDRKLRIDYLDSQIPSADDYLIDPDDPTDSRTN